MQADAQAQGETRVPASSGMGGPGAAPAVQGTRTGGATAPWPLPQPLPVPRQEVTRHAPWLCGNSTGSSSWESRASHHAGGSGRHRNTHNPTRSHLHQCTGPGQRHEHSRTPLGPFPMPGCSCHPPPTASPLAEPRSGSHARLRVGLESASSPTSKALRGLLLHSGARSHRSSSLARFSAGVWPGWGWPPCSRVPQAQAVSSPQRANVLHHCPSPL